jgi:hypothetical protein
MSEKLEDLLFEPEKNWHRILSKKGETPFA